VTGGPVVAAPEQGDADAAQLARFGYGQELKRVLNLFENFAVAFCYISPVVGSQQELLKSDPDITKYVTPYAGQQVVTGQQAQVYADHFIANHLKAIGGGQTYAQLSAKSLADPSNTKLADQVQTMFKGETLRSMLLNAYGWGTIGTYALYAAIGLALAAFVVLGALALEIFLAVREPRKVKASMLASKPQRVIA